MSRFHYALLTGMACLFLVTSAAAQPIPITSCFTTITQSGSYVLTQDLNCIPTTGNGITIAGTATHVTIDLGGFSLAGNTQTFMGISGGDYLSVTDGTIEGWNSGVNSANGGHVLVVRRLVASHQYLRGVTSNSAIVQAADSQFNNRGDGLRSEGSALVVSTKFFANGGEAFIQPQTTAGAILANNITWRNGFGFETMRPGAIYIGNMAAEGDNFGPDCPGTVLTDNVASSSFPSFPAACTLRDNVVAP